MSFCAIAPTCVQVGNQKQPDNQQYIIMSLEYVQNILNRILVNVKSIDLLSDVKTGQASTPYNKIGRHLDLTKLRMTSSEAARPIRPNTALKLR